LNTENKLANVFLSEIQHLTIRKFPSGNVSWIGYWSADNFQIPNSQYKKFRQYKWPILEKWCWTPALFKPTEALVRANSYSATRKLWLPQGNALA
jgi:hypothetical protein